MSETPLRVLFAAAEAVPFVKVGGLADVTGSLPAALVAESDPGTIDVRLAIPLHPTIDLTAFCPTRDPLTFTVPHPDGDLEASAYITALDGVPVYLIDGEPIRAQKTVYSIDTRLDGQKYAFFSLAVLSLCEALDWYPHILHAHDWHTGVAVHLLPDWRSSKPSFAGTRSVFTVHNLPYMGAGTDEALKEYGIPFSAETNLPPWGVNQPLPMALAAADTITAVSPGYAREITTPEFGCGLEEFLRLRSNVLFGVLNGLDLKAYDPASDPNLAQRYDAKAIVNRNLNKLELQAEMGLEVGELIPLIVLISRFDFQKGIDLAIRSLDDLSGQFDFQVVLLGSGNPEIELAARQLESRWPQRVKVRTEFNAPLSRRMYAGGDLLLIPSRYEPCGLTQMLAMRYGCVPVARATGGLRDTIIDAADPEAATGFLFEEATSANLSAAIERSLVTYSDGTKWRSLQLNGMHQDFSWNRSARLYLDIYSSLVNS